MSNTIDTTNWWIQPSSSNTSKTGSKTGDNTGTDKSSTSDFDSFISLLATELSYQDPLNPVSNTEYVSQMAQISSLQRMNDLVGSMDSARAYGMIGKSVAYEVTDSSGSTTTASGTVQGVYSQNNTTYLIIDGNQVKLSSVVYVGATTQ